MRSRPLPAVAACCRRCDPAGLLALLAVFFVLFQLPGPANCLKLTWRFTAVPVELTESEEPQADDSAPDRQAVTAPVRVDPAGPRVSAFVDVVVPLSRRQAVLDAGTTRAPPSA